MMDTVLELHTAPSAEVVTAAELALFMKLDPDVETKDATVLADLVVAARQAVEEYLNRALISQSWQLTINSKPDARIPLPRGEVISITSTTVYDDSDNTYDQSTYYHTKTGEDGEIYLKSGSSWTTSGGRRAGLMVITYAAGYGADETSVPEKIKTAIKQVGTFLYEHREATMIPDHVMSAAHSYRIYPS